jgi:response regulator NasT
VPRSAKSESIVRVVLAGGGHAETGVAVRAAGAECVGTDAGVAEAVARADALDADLVIMDLGPEDAEWMPAAEALWSELGVPTVVIGTREHAPGAQTPGVFGWVAGPATGGALRAVIAVAMARAGEALESAARVEKLEHTLVERRLIEQAKWRLVSTRGMSESEAHSLIQQSARSARRRAIDVAQEILDADPAALGPESGGVGG